jgi:glycosyltransferase involved in cell wall biosynthesis
MNSLLKKEKPDIVHCHMMTGVVICKALKGCRNYKLVSTVHNEFQKTAKLMQLADVVIAVSQQVAEAMIARRISKDKIVVILNGTVFGPRDKFNEHTAIAESEALERPSITAIAGLYRRKGIDILLRAFDLVHKEYPAAHLYIAGEGPDRAYFEDMKAKLSSGEHIKFLGFRNAKKILSETDIFVLPSRVESFGLALSEARAAGCAVMGSNAGGIPEVLERGKAGIIYEVEDYRSLARHILALLNDKDLLNAWKEKAKANIAWLTAERMARDTLALYRRILGNDAL